MKVLYIVGTNLTKNTSANMSHNAYVQGLIESGHNVDIIMESDSWGAQDKLLKRFEEARYFEFGAQSFADKIRKKFSHAGRASAVADPEQADSSAPAEQKKNIKQAVRDLVKRVFYRLFPQDKLYPLDKTWLKKASAFKNNEKYDLVISNSSPAASHTLAGILIEKGGVRTDRWIQIWEDPWYYDLYGGHTEAEKDEEKSLLHAAQEICYVSPITLMYQKRYFPDCADKMKYAPLPYLDFASPSDAQVIPASFGYFGDYYKVTRNLLPFYEALKATGYKGFIYGDGDLSLASDDNIEVSGRVTLDVLDAVQNKTQVLVHLCNLRGGQIPGKVYHYSATDKPILFILDGTEEEKRLLREFFGQFDRYCFCENNAEDIRAAMDRIVREGKPFSPVTAFSPKEVVKRIL